MEHILRIDMGADGGPTTSVHSLGDYAGLGGRGLTSAIVSTEVPATCHPLSGGNTSCFLHRIKIAANTNLQTKTCSKRAIQKATQSSKF